MAALRLDTAAEYSGGRILSGRPETVFTGYTIDSRTAGPGDLFFALPGHRDGHDFIPAASERGARGAMVSRPISPPREGFALLEVPDAIRGLQDLAAAVLNHHPVKIVAVTGSAGKTTTKEFAADLLSPHLGILRSEGNFNNHLGLPLSLLRLDENHEVAVLEMGMSASGEILTLTRIAPPDIAVITNILPVHLQYFDGIEAIALAKKEILDGAKPGAAAVLNGDDALVLRMADGWPGERIHFGLGPGHTVRALDIRTEDDRGMRFTLDYADRRSDAFLPFIGEAFLLDALAAAGICLAFRVPADAVVDGLARLKPHDRRGVFLELENGIRVYDDSYNSNPEALASVLRSLGRLPARRKVAVLGDMLELGPTEIDFHRRAGETVFREGWDLLITAGPLAAHLAEGAEAAGMPRDAVIVFPDARQAAPAAGKYLEPGDLVLVKGSRGMAMDRIVDALKKDRKE